MGYTLNPQPTFLLTIVLFERMMSMAIYTTSSANITLANNEIKDNSKIDKSKSDDFKYKKFYAVYIGDTDNVQIINKG